MALIIKKVSYISSHDRKINRTRIWALIFNLQPGCVQSETSIYAHQNSKVTLASIYGMMFARELVKRKLRLKDNDIESLVISIIMQGERD